MKKKILYILICLLIFSCITVSANAESKYVCVHNLNGEEMNFATKIMKDTTLYAKWNEDSQNVIITM